MKSKRRSFIILLFLVFLSQIAWSQDGNLKTEQRKYARVRQMYEDKYNYMDSLLKLQNIRQFHYELFFMVFKQEQIIEVWLRPKDKQEYILFGTYKFCRSSGDLGPKRRQGDMQIPEGFYHIDRFNPASNFYLSLGLNYPNSADKILGNKEQPGGDIFIHGDCLTVGCIPITNDKIKELYLLALEAKDGGQDKIRVFIFPFRMTDDAMNNMKSNSKYQAYTSFWNELRPAFTYFMENKKLPKISTDAQGKYLVNP